VLSTLRLDHRLNADHAVSLRYNHENQQSLRSAAVTSDTSQVDTFNRFVVEDISTPTQNAANSVHVHLLDHTLATVARNTITAESRPAGNIGQTNRDSQVVPRTKLTASDTFYIHTARHQIKFGGELAFATHDLDAHVLEYGLFLFQTDEPFAEQVPSTWPFAFQQQKPTVFTYRSQELAGFVQDDWRIFDRVWINAGVRYDIDLNLRLNDFSARMLDDPSMVGLDAFISRDRGTDTNNVQPRVGMTWDARGDGRLIIRGGSGVYVTRNRPWYQLRSMNQFGSSVVRISDPARLRNYPDIAAVLGGRTLDSFVAAAGRGNSGR
jgi:outer membrane receptor protein involved in Fe transport